jgi:hypothetical protein
MTFDSLFKYFNNKKNQLETKKKNVKGHLNLYEFYNHKHLNKNNNNNKREWYPQTKE